MKLKNLLILLIAVFAGSQLAFSQKGIVRGKVIDGESGEPMIGATVRLMQDSVMKGGAYTDIEGSYSIENVTPGAYDVLITYVSYAPTLLQAVEVEAGKVAYNESTIGLDIEDDGEKNTVQIYAKVNRASETALLTVKRKSVNSLDVVSAEQFKRSGDNDAGAAMKRVTGVTVEGGKYVYVRGLGDRYSKTLLNGAELPGLDPDRNSVQMDMFPSNLIDNIVVYKTFTPDLPASFTGGLIDVSTKDFPEKFTFQWSSSASFNPQANLRNDFLSYETGKTDFLGFDDGTRAMPALLDDPNFQVPNITFSNQERAENLDRATNAFSTPVFPKTGNSGLNQRHSVSVGNQKKLFGKPFGYIASLTYSDQYSFYNDGNSARWKLTTLWENASTLENLLEFNDSRSNREVLWGGLANFSYKPGENHKLSLNIIHNQSGASETRYLSGRLPDDDPNLIFETRTLGYKERTMSAAQLKGSHNFPTLGKLKMDYVGSFTRIVQDEPDLRFFSNDYVVNGTDTIYDIQPNLYNPPSRYFRNMSETNAFAKVDFELPFKQWFELPAKFKFGGAFTRKSRTFQERRFEYALDNSEVTPYSGNDAEFFADDNLGLAGQDANGSYLWGLTLNDATDLRNTYFGDQSVAAGYAMVDLPLSNKLRLITGARYEGTQLEVRSRDNTLRPGTLNLNDVLPSVNLIWSPKDMMNFRANYSRTLARPTFREIAPFASFEFIRDFVLVGNDTLKRTLIDNIDLRWEYFPSPGELISVSGFFKSFQNPIERVINPIAANGEVNFRNVEQATLYGIEIEVKKGLGFIGEGFDPFFIGGNLTLIQSFLDINPNELAQIRALNPEADDRRTMFGQSPYTINAELAYINDTLGLTSSINFNVFGPRISGISIGGTPNVYEQPRPSLDFSIAKQFGERWSVRLRARNLLNPEYKQTHDFKGTEFVYSSYRIGRSFSAGISYSIR